MNLLRFSAILVVGSAFAAMTAATLAEDKKADYKEKIVGTWQVTKSAGGLPPEANVEFAKDGKLKISIILKGQSKDGKKASKTESIAGAYKVEGDKLTIILKQLDKEHKETMTIKTLTDKELVTVDAQGKEDEFKKTK